MTYCLAINVEGGIVLMSDTRTNAGIDDISRFRKMFTWEVPGERCIAIMSAGNLSITQGVITQLEEAISRHASGDTEVETILSVPTLYRAAELAGAAMATMQVRHAPMIEAAGVRAGASLLFAGQRKGGRPRLFLIYSAGNFIEATRDTPFLQIGDHKYGKPILDRVIRPSTTLNDAAKAAMVSMESTLRSNLSVGMPLDFAVIERDALAFSHQRRIEPGDALFRGVSETWSRSLIDSFVGLPDVLSDDPSDSDLTY